MRSIGRSITALAVLTALLLAASLAGTALAGGRPLAATLTGAAEVGGGDPGASGEARVWANPGLGEVCWDFEISGLGAPAIAAHIHAAPAGVNGPVVIPLAAPGPDGHSAGCAEGVDRSLVLAIIRSPADYYVNVHTTQFPGGAARGQLQR